MSVGNAKISWSVSLTALSVIIFGMVVWSMDQRYVSASDIDDRIRTVLVRHEVDKLRVKIAVLEERDASGIASRAEKTELRMHKSYRAELLLTRNR